MDEIELQSPELYINRELSLLEFNRRVILQALDETVPLLERMRFLCIAGNNLDEFFEIRVSGVRQQIKYGSTQTGPDKLQPGEVLQQISQLAHELVEEQYRVLNEVILPALEKERIKILRRKKWTPKVARWVKRYFYREVLPVLSPIGLDPAHPFPRVLNKNLFFIVSLEGKDAFGRDSGLAIVQAPRALPRVVKVPEEQFKGPHNFLLLSSIIHAHVNDLFPGMEVKGCYQFRVTRNSDLFVDDEEVDDLLRALEGELPSRRYNDAVRLEVADNCPDEVSDFLLKQFKLEEDALYKVNGPVNLSRLQEVEQYIERSDLYYKPFTSSLPPRILKSQNIFDTLQHGDILLHHPYHSFSPVVDFLRQAAHDPNVVSIKQSLYRTGADSKIVAALKEAAKAGKEVTVVVELRARFDEEANIELAHDLQEVGAHVVYGVVGFKTHAKMILVVRREGRRLRRYVHLGTGNYHARTAKLYTDFGLLSSDQAVAEDVNKIFHQLTGLGRAGRLKKLLQSPFTLHKTLLAYINTEADNARANKPARIIAKMNALIEPEIIQALYKASQAGVKIDLIVRGICALRPGIKGVSENIHVRSVIGRFLEHTRVYYFLNNDDPKLFCSSADWMPRNLFYRVETCFPIDEKRPQDQIIKMGLNWYLSDNSQAWLLQADGSYKRVKSSSTKRRAAQELLLEHYCK